MDRRKVLLALVFLWSTWSFMDMSRDTQKGEMIYAEAEDLAGIAGNTELEEPVIQESQEEQPLFRMEEFDLSALRSVNEDVLGWILIPETKVSYPVVQGEDDDYYLNHTWEKEPNAVGAIFLETANNPDLSDFHTIIYGHRMSDGSMLGSLKYYKEQEYAEEHPAIYLVDENGSHCYEIFAAYETPVTGNTYQLAFLDERECQEYLEDCLVQSVIDTGIVPTAKDQIMTLSTCTGRGYDARWVVQARLKK